MVKRGRKPTAAMPKAKTYGYRCEQCPRPEGSEPVLIGGYASDSEAAMALSVHAAVQHQSSWFESDVRFLAPEHRKWPAKTTEDTKPL